jgi:hypothetical protein
MSLEKLYLDALPTSTAGKVRALQEEAVGAKPGVNFLDGAGVAPRAVPPNTYQTEFTRNNAGTFRYNAAGQNGQIPGTDTTEDIESVTASTGLTRWTTTALKKAFLAGNSSLLKKFGTFKGRTYHNYSPLADKSFFAAGGLSEFAKSRVTPSTGDYGPAPAGLAG